MPLNDPVPSTAADVLERNAQDFDRFVVGAENTFVNRLGVEKLTISGINDVVLTGNPAVQAAQQAIAAKNEAQLYAEAAATNADWIYTDVASGEAERADGDYFWVVSADDSEVLELWLMGAATATDTGKRTVNGTYIDGLSENVYHNTIVNGDYVLGEPNYRTTESTVMLTDQTELIDRGYTGAMQRETIRNTWISYQS